MTTQAIEPSLNLANGCLKKPYIGRRTGKVIDIVARKNSDGFENVNDYFPDSELDSEDNSEISQTAVTRSNKNNSSEVSKSKQLASNTTSKNVDATSNDDPNELTKSTAQNSLGNDCSPDSAFDSPEEDPPASVKVYSSANKGSASHSCPSKATGEHGAMDGNGVPAASNISPETNADGMAVGQSSLEEDEEDGTHTTRKRLHFSTSSEPDTQTEKNSSPAKQAINEDKNSEVTDEDGGLIIVERAKTTPNTSLAKKNVKNKKTIKQGKTMNNPKNEIELIIEDICKSEDTFLTLKKKANPRESKLVDNNNLESSITLSIKPLASRKNTQSKIPVRKSRAKVVYPKRGARKRVETAETTQGDTKQVEVSVETKTNEMHFGPIFENQYVDETEEDEIPEQMSVESETDTYVEQETSSLQRSSHVKTTTEKKPQKRGKQMASSGPKLKSVVNRKTRRKKRIKVFYPKRNTREKIQTVAVSHGDEEDERVPEIPTKKSPRTNSVQVGYPKRNTREKIQTVAVSHGDEEDERVPEIPIETNQEVETEDTDGSDDNEVGDQMSADVPGAEQESVSDVSLQQSSHVGRKRTRKTRKQLTDTEPKSRKADVTKKSPRTNSVQVGYPKRNTRGKIKIPEATQDEEEVVSVPTETNEEVQSQDSDNEVGDNEESEEDTGAEQESVSDVLQQSSQVDRKRTQKSPKQAADTDPKSRKAAVNKKSQRTNSVQVGYPKQNTSGEIKISEAMQDEDVVPEVPTETDQEVETEYTDGSEDGNEVGDQMSVESEASGPEQKSVSHVSLQQSSQVGRKRTQKSPKQMVNTEPKSRKTVVNKKSQRKNSVQVDYSKQNTREQIKMSETTQDEEEVVVFEVPTETNEEIEIEDADGSEDDNEVGDQMSVEYEDPAAEQDSVSGVSLQQSSQVGRKRTQKSRKQVAGPKSRKAAVTKKSQRTNSVQVGYPKQITRGRMKMSETTQDDEEVVFEVPSETNEEVQSQDSDNDEVDENEQMSVQSEDTGAEEESVSDLSTQKSPKQVVVTEPKSRKAAVTKKSQRTNSVQVGYPKRNTRKTIETEEATQKDGEKEETVLGPKSRKTVAKRKSQGTEAVDVEQSAPQKKEKGAVKPTTTKVQAKPATKRRVSAGHATRTNTQQEESRKNSTSSYDESIGDAGPIKSTSINMEKDSEVNGEVMEEDTDTSVEDGVDQSLKPPKYQGNKIDLDSVLSDDILNTSAQNDGGLRRSHRNRVPTLQYWKNERIEYDRRKSGWIVKDVIVNPTPEVNTRKRKNNTKSATRRAKKGAKASNLKEESELSDVYIPEGFEEQTDPVGTVINSDTLKEVKMNLIHSNQMLDFQPPVQNEDDDDDDSSSAPLLVDKYFSHAMFGAGQVILRPGAEKGRQNVRGDTMVFYISSGCVLVTIHEDSFVLPRGSSFFIPQGNVYNLKNLDNKKDACLFFTQIKG